MYEAIKKRSVNYMQRCNAILQVYVTERRHVIAHFLYSIHKKVEGLFIEAGSDSFVEVVEERPSQGRLAPRLITTAKRKTAA